MMNREVGILITDVPQPRRGQREPPRDPGRARLRAEQVGQLGAAQHGEEPGKGVRTGDHIIELKIIQILMQILCIVLR